MKIALIGYGYWGKILYNNLKSFDIDLVVCDAVSSDYPVTITNYRDISDVESVIVAVPCTDHYDICKHFLEKGISVFCEKPLTFTLQESIELYEIAEKNNTVLFVDWIFLYNTQVNKIKDIVNSMELGKLISVNMRRLNKGPARHDVNSLYDLSSHDFSILFHILGSERITTLFSQSYKMNKLSIQNDSFSGLYDINDVLCSIQSSWEYPIKDRCCFFEFEKGIIQWDDTIQSLKINGIDWISEKNISPLLTSIGTFLYNVLRENEKKLTLKIMEIIQ